jgi:Family of unknown function (DUF6214)
MQRTELELQTGPGGWVEAVFHHEDLVLTQGYVRLTRRDGEWLTQGTLYLPGLSAETLRTFLLRRIQLAVAASPALQRDLEARMNDDVPDIGTNEFHAAFAGFAHPEPALTLKRPAGRRIPDGFYRQVAETYRGATARGLRPRLAIAEAAGTSTDVAGRWIYEARKRGHLPPTTPGKVNA